MCCIDSYAAMTDMLQLLICRLTQNTHISDLDIAENHLEAIPGQVLQVQAITI